MWGFVIDGVFGPKTEAAVKEVQQGAGLIVFRRGIRTPFSG